MKKILIFLISVSLVLSMSICAYANNNLNGSNNMSKEYEILQKSYDSIKNKIPYEVDIAVVLGSGLGKFLDNKKIDAEIRYEDIANFPRSTVEGHAGNYAFLKINNKKIVCMNGRVHHYEGYETIEVVRPIRLMKMMGAKTIILTNAAGGLNENFVPGDLMIINDHISQFVKSPLIGENVGELGVRFPDMTNVYDKEYIELVKKIAKEQKIDIKSGVYLQFTGPNYETPTEIKMAKTLGADAVGMSTVVEAIAARHMGVKVLGISLITNMGAGISKNELSHEEVKETADKAAVKFENLLDKILTDI